MEVNALIPSKASCSRKKQSKLTHTLILLLTSVTQNPKSCSFCNRSDREPGPCTQTSDRPRWGAGPRTCVRESACCPSARARAPGPGCGYKRAAWQASRCRLPRAALLSSENLPGGVLALFRGRLSRLLPDPQLPRADGSWRLLLEVSGPVGFRAFAPPFPRLRAPRATSGSRPAAALPETRAPSSACTRVRSQPPQLCFQG